LYEELSNGWAMTDPVAAGVMGLALGACLGAAFGAGIVLRWLRPKLVESARALSTLRAQLDEASGAQVQLAELRSQLSHLRHDLRGILSPTLLVADRLIGSEDASVRRAGDVVIRTVERATARLIETGQAPGPDRKPVGQS
jgi:hypothetical protein